MAVDYVPCGRDHVVFCCPFNASVCCFVHAALCCTRTEPDARESAHVRDGVGKSCLAVSRGWRVSGIAVFPKSVRSGAGEALRASSSSGCGKSGDFGRLIPCCEICVPELKSSQSLWWRSPECFLRCGAVGRFLPYGLGSDGSDGGVHRDAVCLCGAGGVGRADMLCVLRCFRAMRCRCVRVCISAGGMRRNGVAPCRAVGAAAWGFFGRVTPLG